MAQNTKTPAMVLQEFTVKRGCAPPEYILVMSKTGTHQNEFHYKVNVFHISGIGFGRSKQVAKHSAASNALEILAQRGVYDPSSNPVQEFNAQSHRNESDSPMLPTVNYIGTLKDKCCDSKLPYPVFEEISDVGPPHCREFTCQCKIASLTTQATANTKKQAKQLAAREMLEKIRDICPELVECSNALTDVDQKAMAKHSELAENLGVMPNRAVKLEDFTLTLRKIMDEKGVTVADFKDQFCCRDLESLDYICKTLDVKYQMNVIQESPVIISIIFGLETPFSVLAVGNDLENAKRNAISRTFVMLNVYMSVPSYLNNSVSDEHPCFCG